MCERKNEGSRARVVNVYYHSRAYIEPLESVLSTLCMSKKSWRYEIRAASGLASFAIRCTCK